MNTTITAKQTISATIIRADGTKEELGVISQTRVLLTRSLLQKFKQIIKRDK